MQGKGASCPDYAALTRRSARAWGGFAEALDDTGGEVPLGYRACGGIRFARDEDELATMRKALDHPGPASEGMRVVDAAGLRALLPAVGPEVPGGIHCADDGHADPLATLRALHRAMRRAGGRVLRGKVRGITAKGTGFVAETEAGRVVSGRVVLAAGLGSVGLGEPLGLKAALRPQRGQVIVTERVARFMDLACQDVRQTEEGTVMLGDSHEEVGFDTGTTPEVTRAILRRAVRYFPHLSGVRMMRTWGALRVMSPDGLPIYQTSEDHPGASLVTCHSGVTLAAAHAGEVAQAILEDRLNETYPAFSAGRFEGAA